MKNATLKKRVMATLVSATVAFGGVAVAAPSADADIRITSQYSALDNAEYSAAVQYNRTAQVKGGMDILQTSYGPGWCIDAHLPSPNLQTAYEVRKLDGTSGLYGYNPKTGGDLKIHPDIERAAVNLTKLLLNDYKAGRAEDVKKKNAALQALLSNNQRILDEMRGLIIGDYTAHAAPGGVVPPKITAQEFLQWTGFEVRRYPGNVLGQGAYYLSKNDAYAAKLNAKSGEYVTVLVPRSYNVYENLRQEPTNQRIVIIGQPGLEGYEPNVVKERVTQTVTQSPVTVTKTVPGSTITLTNRVVPGDRVDIATTRPTVTQTEYVQPIDVVTETVKRPDVTITNTRRPDVVTATATYTQQRETETVTVTAPQRTVTVEERTPVIVTKNETVRPTATVTAAQQTASTTLTVAPEIVTVTKTNAPETKTVTQTAEPSTKVVETTVTSTNRQTIEKTVEVERYFRKFTYAFDFGLSGKTETIPVDKLGDWEIEFIDDSNGLVKVEKVIIDGKAVLQVTPVKEGRGTVRVVVVDNDGNRHEYTINVVNESTKTVVTNEVTVNNHYFNVGVGQLQQTITVPEGWDFRIKDGGNLITTEEVSGGRKIKVNEGVIAGTVVIEVVEKVNGKETGAKDVYTFKIDGSGDIYNQTRVIGNANSYKLEVKDVPNKPEIVSGEDLIDSIEKNAEGFWIVTPKIGAEGEVVIRATDKDGKVYTYTLTIKQGTNVLVDNEVHRITEGDKIEVTGPENSILEQVTGDKAVWRVVLDEATNTWIITNKGTGTATFNLYQKVEQGNEIQKVLVGVYTVVASPVQTSDYVPVTINQDVKDRNTVVVKKGEPNSELRVKEGEGNFSLVTDDYGDWNILPNPGFEGKIVIEELFQGKVIATYNINVTPGAVDKAEKDVKSGSTLTISGLKGGTELRPAQGAELRVVEGLELIEDGKISVNGTIKFVPGANGRVVIENLNSRGLPFQRFTFNVTPSEPRTETIELRGNSSATLNFQENVTWEITGDKLVTVVKEGNQFVIKPVDGLTEPGETTVDFKNERGEVVYRYVVKVTPRQGDASTTTRSNDFKLSTEGKFTITRVNDDKIDVIVGKEYVNPPKEENGQWILTPKGPESIGKQVVVTETRGDIVVKRHTITITEQPQPLNFTEERRVYETELNGRIIPAPGNTLVVRRGYDVITEQKLPNGELRLTPIDDKSGTVVIEEMDKDGNPVRIVELQVPFEPGEIPPAPIVSVKVKENRDDDGRLKTADIKVEGGSNSVEINLCTQAGSCSPFTGKVTPKEDGTVTVEPGTNLPDGAKIEVIPVENGVKLPESKQLINLKVNVGNQNQTTADGGSSELDGKCIAALVGLSVPLLLAIPVGILSQVQIPGLEGVSAQINEAIRRANDEIQRGLGIYDRDRAERAAGIQGAFSAVNPQMIGLAGGALGAITAGLLILDGVLRACGQAEATSSYQIGKATDNETLMNASSVKTGTNNNAGTSASEAPKK